MKKMILTAAAAAIALGVQAEFKNNPDTNTLWSESGLCANIVKDWRLPKGKMEAGPDKMNFNVVCTARGGDFGRYVSVSNDYPWMVIKVVKAEPGKDYTALGNFFLGGPDGIAMGVSKILPGTYVKKITFDPKKKNMFLRTDFYGKELTIGYMGMQKVPEVMPEFANKSLKKGDELVLTVTLQKPADEITVKFFKRSTMPQLKLNGKKSYDLTADASKKVWTLKVPFQSIDGFNGKKIKANEIIFEMDITRGEEDEKFFTLNSFEIQ